ncbi:PLD nuclease N-terminal domain-containing protein [Streptomyces sp. NPDC055254]
MLRYLPFLLLLALTIYAFIDCLNTPEEEVKHLPKAAWVFIILLFSIVGPVVWLAAGRKRVAAGGGGLGGGGLGGGRARRTRWVAPDDNPEFLKSLRDERDDRERREKRERRDGGADGAPGEDGRTGDGGAEDGDTGKDTDKDTGKDTGPDKGGPA